MPIAAIKGRALPIAFPPLFGSSRLLIAELGQSGKVYYFSELEVPSCREIIAAACAPHVGGRGRQAGGTAGLTPAPETPRAVRHLRFVPNSDKEAILYFVLSSGLGVLT